MNNKNYSFETISAYAQNLIKTGTENECNLGLFILNWVDENEHIDLQTSGTTSEPKVITISKTAFVNSAKSTGSFFNLSPGDSALCCLPFSYVAAKMMFVRAWVLGLKLDFIEPSSHPLQYLTKVYDFSAMVPLQVHNCFSKINKIKTLLIGGAHVSDSLANKLKDHSSAVFETFGMTETVSHIAVKNLTNGEEHFIVLPEISVATNDNGCLIINAPKLSSRVLHTKDVVSLTSKNSFVWLGRYDNVINSGGLKIYPEQLEKIIQNQIKRRFFVTSMPDIVLGQKVVLIIEGKPKILHLDFSAIEPQKHPKNTYFIDKFCTTNSGKVQRQKTVETLNLDHS
ncbi:MAG: AMP-binding protein [Bacteroidetes bacterium]|nr:AMP-binding protein [Bacteroidota bacterium]